MVRTITGTSEDGVVRVNGVVLNLTVSQRVRNHSPSGFAWGYEGSGPAQLALAILLHCGIDRVDAVRLYQRFKREVVGRWEFGKDVAALVDVEAWAMGQDEVNQNGNSNSE